MASEFRAERTLNVLVGSDGEWYPLSITKVLKMFMFNICVLNEAVCVSKQRNKVVTRIFNHVLIDNKSVMTWFFNFTEKMEE